MSLAAYETVVFDCDGVILDSNRLKTDAFRLAALPYGTAAADALVRHHVSTGGISRYVKFRHFLDEIVPQHAAGQKGPDHAELLEDYAHHVQTGLTHCAVAQGLMELRAARPDQRWLIVSGGSQAELRKVFAERGLADMFGHGIFGSPDTKDEILAREKAAGTIAGRTVFLGDSTYDHRAATAAGLDFVFVSGWSEVPDWQGYVTQHDLKSVTSLAAFLSSNGADETP